MRSHLFGDSRPASVRAHHGLLSYGRARTREPAPRRVGALSVSSRDAAPLAIWLRGGVDAGRFSARPACARQVQYPGAERVMMSDLRNLRTLAWFLQKFELNFDILSSLRELSKQIKNEFDFRSGSPRDQSADLCGG